MANKQGGTLYIGVTSNLPKRVYEHQSDVIAGFTKKYGCHTLVYAEFHEEIAAAILREKQMKKWNRAWKLRLINQKNPRWEALEIFV